MRCDGTGCNGKIVTLRKSTITFTITINTPRKELRTDLFLAASRST